jgi:hypothetical protein
MNSKRFFVLLLMTVAALNANASRLGNQQSRATANEPRFQDYPTPVYAGKAALLNLRTHPLARLYRTRLRAALNEEGINFAGHYTFATIGCGAGCSVNAIVDARTGRAFFPRPLNGWTGIVGDFDREDEYEEQTRADSRLLRMLGRPRIGSPKDERYGPSGIYFFEWANDRLRLLKVIKVGSHPTNDPNRRR